MGTLMVGLVAYGPVCLCHQVHEDARSEVFLRADGVRNVARSWLDDDDPDNRFNVMGSQIRADMGVTG